jgi:hypothetical protein
MGVTCSLLGHDYGAEETDRQREERGDEVVITERELRVCSRCGAELVTSENTEVRSVKADREAAGADTEDTEPETEARPGTRAGPEVDIDADVGPETSGSADASGGDAVILEDDGEDPEPPREPGEWPDADDTRLDEQETATEPANRSDTPEPENDEQTEILGGSTGGKEGADDGASEPDASGEEEDTDPTNEETPTAGDWPDPGPGGADEGFDATSPDDEGGSEMIEAEPGSAGAEIPTDDGPSGKIVLVCPSCGFTEGATGSSHRSGDICPECKRGYLSERAP